MPSRFVSLVILIYWSVAAFFLLTRDVLPKLTLGYPPDLRAIAFAGNSATPVRWSIGVRDDPKNPEAYRTVGEAVTTSSRRPDGRYELGSHVEVDAGSLLQGTPFETRSSVRLVVESQYHVDSSGNLNSFEIQVKSKEFSDELMTVKGQLKGKEMVIIPRGPLPILNNPVKFDYEPRSVVQDVLGPLDRLPGLNVGQRWETRVINPFTGKVEGVRAEVERRTTIHWEGNPVSTYEVVQSMAPVSKMRTWVREDGVILRQEVPFPFVRLVLERKAETAAVPPASQTRGSTP